MAGGLTKGKSHAKGGIKMEVKSTGQNIEVEGGEGIINKHTMSSKDKFDYEGKDMTACEIASDLNQKTGNGVSFDCDETDNTDMTPTDQSTGFAKGGKTKAPFPNAFYIIVKKDGKRRYVGGDSASSFIYLEDARAKAKKGDKIIISDGENEIMEAFDKGGKPKRKYKKKKMAKSKKKTGAYAKLVSKIMKRDGVTYREAQKKAKDEYVSGATSQKKKPKKTYKGRVDNLKSKSATKISYSGRPKKAKGGELMDADTEVDYAKGGDVSGKPVVESLDKIVTHYNGDEFELDNYPPKDGAEWMSDAMELTLEEAKQFAKELDYELNYDDEYIDEAENLQDLQYAILENTEQKANHDNTYNASWWGGVVDFFVLERKEDDGYGKALVILRMHRGGDPRGNYYGYQAFKLNSFIEDFPAYYARLTYQIKTNQGTITLDTEDMEGYTLLVVEDETGTFEVDDNVSIDDIDDKLDMNTFSIYAKGGQTKKFNNGGNIMDKKLELAASLEKQLEEIDFQYLDWDEINSFDELEEAVDNNGFFQQEVIYYATAMNYLREEDNSLTESLGLAADMGYQTENINSELLASILKSERVRESFYELRTEIDDFFDELED